MGWCGSEVSEGGCMATGSEAAARSLRDSSSRSMLHIESRRQSERMDCDSVEVACW